MQVVEIEKKMLGEEHPDTLESINILASSFRSQKRRKETVELQRQLMKTKIRLLGDEHPDTLHSISNLALTFRNQERWKEAAELQMQVVKIEKKLFGEEHPCTLASISSLASTFRNQKRWKEAVELEMQLVKTKTRVLGAEHPDTLRSISNLNLAFMPNDQGRWNGAEELEAQVMELRKKLRGTEHSTLTNMIDLSPALHSQGKPKEQVLEVRKILSDEHSDTLIESKNSDDELIAPSPCPPSKLSEESIVSPFSQYSTEELFIAKSGLISIFANDESLQPSYSSALKNPSIDTV